ADAAVENDLLHPRDLHHVAELELGLERGSNFGEVPLLQARTRVRRRGAHSSLPHLRQTRTLVPSAFTRYPALTGPSLLHTSMRFDTWMGIALSWMPPCMVARVGFWCFLATLIPCALSTITRPLSGKTWAISPVLPMSLPWITWTWSPFLSFI